MAQCPPCPPSKLLYMYHYFAGTSVYLLPTGKQVHKLTGGTNAASASLSLFSAFIFTPVFVGVIRLTGFVYYCCIMTVQQVGHVCGCNWHCEHSPGSMSPYYNKPCNEIQAWVRVEASGLVHSSHSPVHPQPSPAHRLQVV